jgi:hypothetical protein
MCFFAGFRHLEFVDFIVHHSTADARVQINKTRWSFESFTEVHRMAHLNTTTQNESEATLVNGRMTAWRHASGLAMRR